MLKALKLRPWTEEALLAVLPVEHPLLSAEQQQRALGSVLARLRVKSLIFKGEDGWRLTA